MGKIDTRAHENVSLVGGPCDGERISWRGGDCIYMAARPAASWMSVEQMEKERAKGPSAEPKAALYRRSLETRHLFVFQP